MKRLFIFGNGASIAEGAPLWQNLISAMLNIKESEIRKLSQRREFFDLNFDQLRNNLDLCKQNLKNFLNIYFKEHDKFEPSFSDLYPLLQILIDNNEGLIQNDDSSTRYDSQKLKELLDNIIWLLSVTLDYNLLESKGLHNQFVNCIGNLFNQTELMDFSFINLNYDILLDNALLGLQHPNDVDLNYHIDFANFEFDQIRNLYDFRKRVGWTRPRENQNISLLKLHGSFNWLVCPFCNRIEITPKIKGATQCVTDNYNCVWDNYKQNILLVPPTIEELMKNPNIQKLWSIAETKIRNSDIIYFIGYSLSEYDIYIRKMLKKFMLQGQQKTIYLICRSPASEEQNAKSNNVTLRYKRFFSDNIIDTGLSFQSLIERLDFLSNCKNSLLINENDNIESMIFGEIDKLIVKRNYIQVLFDILDEETLGILYYIRKQNERTSVGNINENSDLDIEIVENAIRCLLNFNLIVKDKRDEKLRRFDKKTSYFTNEKWRREIDNNKMIFLDRYPGNYF